MLRLFFILLLTAVAWGRTPEDTVRKLYATHDKTDNLDRTVQLAADCFTPGFLSIFQRALAIKPDRGGAFVDVDVLVDSQGGWGDYVVGRAIYDGENVVVPVTLWTGLRSGEVRKDPKLRASWPTRQARVHLTDVGNGYQIYDIEFPARRYKIQGQVYSEDASTARAQLLYVLNWKKPAR